MARARPPGSPPFPAPRRRALAMMALVVATLALAVAHAPAVLIDGALAQASAGRFRLALPAGTLWHGEARLATSDGGDAIVPLSWLVWDFEPAALGAATLRWRLRIDGAPPARLDLGLRGMTVEHLALELPPAAALAPLAHAAARAGWRGILAVKIERLACDWQQRCAGHIDVAWRAAGVDILPGVALGDHRVATELTPAAAKLQISTTRRQALALDGRIEIPVGAPPRIALDLGGDAQLLDRLRGMLAELRPTGDGQRLRIRY